MTFFTSPTFYILLAPAVWAFFGLHHKLTSFTAKNVLLLFINLFFLLFLFKGNVNVVGFIVFLASFVYGVARSLAKSDARGRSLKYQIGIFLILLTLGLCKYQSFSEIPGLNQLRSFIFSPWILKDLIQVIGISFLSFKCIHFLYEVYHQKIPKFSYLTFLNYILFFPVFICGPMDRYPRFLKDLHHPDLKKLSAQEALWAGFRVLIGLFKAIALVNLFAYYSVSKLPLDILEFSSQSKLFFSAYAFSFLLYFDFSGYSDMAIGVSRFLGIRTPENFNFPYSATSIQEFWNRWHLFRFRCELRKSRWHRGMSYSE